MRKRRQSNWRELNAVANFVARIIWAAIAIIGMSVLTATTVKADLVLGGTEDISAGGSHTITNADGLGIDLVSTFTGFSATQTVTYAGWGIGGDATRFGWETTRIGTDIIHPNNYEFTLDTNGTGTFDARIGFGKVVGSPLDFLNITTDGTWSVVGSVWTQTGGTIDHTGGLTTFSSSDPGGGFNSEVTGATFLTFSTANQTIDFGDRTQQFDINLLSATPAVVPEPSPWPVLALIVFGWFLKRRRSYA